MGFGRRDVMVWSRRVARTGCEGTTYIVEQCGCLCFSSYCALDVIPVLIVTPTTLRMKNEWKGGECRRKSLSPKEVRELCHNVQSCLFTFAILRVSLASGPSQKSFLQAMEPYHGVIFVSNEVQLWLFGGLEPLQRGIVSLLVWFPVRSCEGEFFCLLVVFTGLWFR